MGCSSSAAQPAPRPPGAEVVYKREGPEVPAGDFQDLARFHRMYTLGTQLGKGAFATVHLCHCNDGHDMAVKVLDVNADNSMADSIRARKEMTVWCQAGQHPNIVSLVGAFSDGHRYYFLMERCAMSLLKHILDLPQLNEASLAHTSQQMLTGLVYFHKQNLIHRDIKPDNFLVTGAGVIKLSDFGLSTFCTFDPEKSTSRSLCTTFGQIGTAPFMSPEMLSRQPYGHGVDVWSIGVCMYLMLCGQFPYMPSRLTPDEMKNAIVTGEALPRFRTESTSVLKACDGNADPSDAAREFMQALLDRDPQKRVSASRALQSEYICKAGQHTSSMPPLKAMIASAVCCGAFAMEDCAKELIKAPLKSHAQTRRPSWRSGDGKSDGKSGSEGRSEGKSSSSGASLGRFVP